jgi:hypothetical protein
VLCYLPRSEWSRRGRSAPSEQIHASGQYVAWSEGCQRSVHNIYV